MTTRAGLDDIGDLEDLYPLLPSMHFGPGWNKPTPSLWMSPEKLFLPNRWSYEDARAALDVAGRLIDTNLAERRNLILINPLEGNEYGTSRTLVAAYQMLLPGEVARSHRHTPNALRLVMDVQPGAYTIIDGVEVPMTNGDVVLTPNWSWHGHGNRSNAPAYWIDFLDVPLLHFLQPMFTEFYPGGYEPTLSVDPKSPFTYALADVEEQLADAPPDPSGCFGRQVALDRSKLKTIALHMMLLQPNEVTSPLQTTANSIYAVVRGRGRSVIEGRAISWSRGDVFVAPSWHVHQHEASENAILFRVSDEPTLAAFDWLRTLTLPRA